MTSRDFLTNCCRTFKCSAFHPTPLLSARKGNLKSCQKSLANVKEKCFLNCWLKSVKGKETKRYICVHACQLGLQRAKSRPTRAYSLFNIYESNCETTRQTSTVRNVEKISYLLPLPLAKTNKQIHNVSNKTNCNQLVFMFVFVLQPSRFDNKQFLVRQQVRERKKKKKRVQGFLVLMEVPNQQKFENWPCTKPWQWVEARGTTIVQYILNKRFK